MGETVDTSAEAHDWAQLRRLAEAATPGERKYTARPDGSICFSAGDPVRGPHRQGDHWGDANDAAFDAAAHPAAVLALLDRAERAEAERDALKARCEACALFTCTPGAMTVNCVRGTVRCTERERIEAERDRNLEALAEMAQRYAREGLAERARAERAEAEAARLREALQQIDTMRASSAGQTQEEMAYDMRSIAKAALAAKEPGHENTPKTEVGRP